MAKYRTNKKKLEQADLVRVFKALGNENRMKILDAIRTYQTKFACCPKDFENMDLRPGSICCVDEITGKFDMAQSTISQHLKELHTAGLLERHKRAQWVYYTINTEMIKEVVAFLGEMV